MDKDKTSSNPTTTGEEPLRVSHETSVEDRGCVTGSVGDIPVVDVMAACFPYRYACTCGDKGKWTTTSVLARAQGAHHAAQAKETR